MKVYFEDVLLERVRWPSPAVDARGRFQCSILQYIEYALWLTRSSLAVIQEDGCFTPSMPILALYHSEDTPAPWVKHQLPWNPCGPWAEARACWILHPFPACHCVHPRTGIVEITDWPVVYRTSLHPCPLNSCFLLCQVPSNFMDSLVLTSCLTVPPPAHSPCSVLSADSIRFPGSSTSTVFVLFPQLHLDPPSPGLHLGPSTHRFNRGSSSFTGVPYPTISTLVHLSPGFLQTSKLVATSGPSTPSFPPGLHLGQG